MIKKGLGKGFSSLIPEDIISSEFDTTSQMDNNMSKLGEIDIAKIDTDPDQPRKDFDIGELEELAQSIKEHGVLQPIVVVPKGDRYEVVAGERRLRASRMIDLKTIPAIIRTMTSQNRLEVSIIENLQRADLNPLEVATAFVKLRNQFSMPDKEISKRIGWSVPAISNTIRLLKLPDVAKDAIVAGKMSEAHARQILAVDDPEVQEYMIDRVVYSKWSVSRLEQFVIDYRNKGSGGAAAVDKSARATQAQTPFTRSIASRLGFNEKAVTNKQMSRGGKITIRYQSDEEMAKIAKALGIDI